MSENEDTKTPKTEENNTSPIKSVIKDGWFHEIDDDLPGQRTVLQMDKVLFHEKSPYQEILIFENAGYGRVMVLDGLINSTEKDECAYHEMISFVPLNAHPDPKHVLIIGGGDGGVARECAKHPKVEQITMAEIDVRVVEASKEHLPYMACGLKHPKVTLHITDGLHFLHQTDQSFDVIIADTSDPEGPAEQLFTRTFYEAMKSRLNPGGILCTQGLCVWMDIITISKVVDFARLLFPTVAYACGSVPSYTTGYSGYILCSMEEGKDFRTPLLEFSEEEKTQMGLKFYDEDVHRGAFALPRFVKKELGIMSSSS